MEDRRLYLELIQAIITRMNNNSFLIKGWAITLITGIFAVAISSGKYDIFYLSFFIVLMFWFLDGYYLYQERLYRGLYNHVRLNKAAANYDLDARLYKSKKNSWLYSTFSLTLFVFYCSLLLITIGILCVV